MQHTNTHQADPYYIAAARGKTEVYDALGVHKEQLEFLTTLIFQARQALSEVCRQYPKLDAELWTARQNIHIAQYLIDDFDRVITERMARMTAPTGDTKQ